MKASNGQTAVDRLRLAALLILGVFIFASTFSIAISQTALVLAVILWGVLLFMDPTSRPGGLGLALPLLLFTLVSILSSILCDDPTGALKNLRNYLLFITVWIVASLASNRSVREKIFGILLVSGTGSAVYGIVIYSLGMGRGSLGRTPGSFSNSMTYGGIMMLLLSLFAAVSIGRGIDRRLRIITIAASVTAAFALIFTQTRSSWAGMFVSCVVMLAVLRRRLIPLFLVAAVVAAIFMPQKFHDRIMTIWDPGFRTNIQRINLIKGGISIIREYPVLGTGPVDLGDIYREHMPPEAVHVHGHMHNIFLHVAVTLGSVGLVMFVWLIASIVRIVGRTLRLDLPPTERALAAGSLGAVTGFIVNGMFDWNFGDAEVLTMMLIIVGFNAAIITARSRMEEIPANVSG